jgi:hypothetical protein
MKGEPLSSLGMSGASDCFQPQPWPGFSEITVNVCLGRQFTGGNVYFNGQRDTASEKREQFEFAHKPGVAIIHIGQHWHGARRIQSGERYNVVLWSRSTRYHQSPLEQYVAECAPLKTSTLPAALHTEL